MLENEERDDNLTVVNTRQDSSAPTVIKAAAVKPPELIYRGGTPAGSPPPPPPLTRESAARDRARKRRVTPQQQGGQWAWVIIAIALLGVVLVVTVGIFVAVRATRETVAVLPTAAITYAELPTPVSLVNQNAGVPGFGDTLVLNDGTSVALVPWDGQTRLTVLMMGLDRRPGETGLGYRTDTLMLLSIDPFTSEIGVLSIPRDLYVEVPGYSGMRRINEPMVLGELREPGYGPVLAAQTVQYNLGIRVNHYVVVDFDTFITLVDALGGITIEIDYNISDPQYPGMNYDYDPFYLRAGVHTLDGRTALKFARTRHGDSDIQRAERQQQVLFAVRDSVLEPDALPRLLGQAPVLWDSLRENVYTDLTFDQIVHIGLYVKDIPMENIRTGVINYQYLQSWTTPQGASVLIPNRSRLATLMTDVFGMGYAQ